MILDKFKIIEEKIKTHFNKELGGWQKNTDLEQYIKKTIQQVSRHESATVKKRLYNEYFHFGPIEKILNEKNIEEIIINGPYHIWVESHGKMQKINDQFLSDTTYKNFINTILQKMNVQMNINTPYVNGKWKSFRVHMISPPLTQKYIEISLRKHLKDIWSFEKLKEKNWASEKSISFIKQILKQRENFIVVGPTSTGKTTILNSCLNEIKKERVIIIEDTDELHCPNFLSTKLLTRTDYEKLKDYDQSDLVKQALRMRPDRIAIGEMRYTEAKDFLLALSTGHKGCFCSLHAETAQQALIRLEMLIQMGASYWNLEMIRRLIFLSLKYIIVLEKKQNQRVLEGIYKIDSLEKFGFLIEKIT